MASSAGAAGSGTLPGGPVPEGGAPGIGPEVELRALRRGEATDAARLIRATLAWERRPEALLLCLRKRAVALAFVLILITDVAVLRLLAGCGWGVAVAGGGLGALVTANGMLRSRLFSFRRETLLAGGKGSDVADIYGHYVREGSMFFVAMLGEVMVGCVGVDGKSASTAEIRRMMVMEGLQGNGIGGNLLRRALAFCRAGGYRKVTLMTSEAQVAAQHLYESNGFQQVGEGPLVTLIPRKLAGLLGGLGIAPHPRDWSVTSYFYELDLMRKGAGAE